MSILEIQKALKAAGYDPGPLDGIDGPRTHAALTAFQQAKGLSTAGPDWGKTEAALKGSTPEAAATATPQEEYPGFAWAMDDPELGGLLRRAVGWTPDKFQAELQKTDWWKKNSQAARSWMTLAGTDPAEAERRLHGLDSAAKLQRAAALYGLPWMPMETALRRAERVVRGEVTSEQAIEELKNQAKQLYPHLGERIDAGSTVDEIFESYRGLIADELGISDQFIHVQDQKWAKFLTMPENGGSRPWTLDETRRELRTNGTYGWDKTQGAKDASVELRVGMEEGLGLRR